MPGAWRFALSSRRAGDGKGEEMLKLKVVKLKVSVVLTAPLKLVVGSVVAVIGVREPVDKLLVGKLPVPTTVPLLAVPGAGREGTG